MIGDLHGARPTVGHADRGGAEDDERAEAFEAVRPRLHGVAYRMTGSLSDADDICQGAWLRWAEVDRSSVRDHEGYLVRVVTRLAIDRQRSAAVRRESYVGPYLPEPLVRDRSAVAGAAPSPGPEAAAELADSLTFAFLVLLDELDPVERAVLLLHDVFGYPFGEVASIVERSEASVRQLASRSRRRIHERRGDDAPPAATADLEQVLLDLLGAVAAGDVDAVMAHLAPDVVQLDDGGPNRRASRRPIVGPHRVARLWVNLARRHADLELRLVDVNGRLGLLFTDDGHPFMVATAELDADGRVHRIYSQLNPDKLSHVPVTADDD